jgi:hypothetical protein
MRSIPFVLIAICCVAPLALPAQLATNLPPTEIQNFELQNDTVIVKGFGEIGSVAIDGGTVSIRCKESDNVMTGSKMYGIAVVLESNQAQSFFVVDDDEMEALMRGLDYLGKISYDVTTMPAFDANFTTRSGLRIAAHSERREGSIELYLQFGDVARLPVTAEQYAQFKNLIGQAKKSLDVTKSKNSSS